MKKLLLILITLQISVSMAMAEVDLYTGEVVVASQSEADRNEAIPEALIQVLQKLSGLREMPLSSALDEALANADRYLRSYRYDSVDRFEPDGAINRELHLVVQFMQPEVDRVVLQAGLPRWRQERPGVQLWVILDDGLNRDLKPLEYGYAWQSLEEIAGNRGLSVVWPELDEEEIQLVDTRMVWGGFTEYLIERGAPTDGVAIVAIRREGPLWTVRWNLASGAQTWSWRTSDKELMFALAQGIHQMTDYIASENSIAASEQGMQSVDISIGRLNGADDYFACLDYLQNLSLVTSVEILGANPGMVHFRLQLNAPLEHLLETFDRGARLLPAKTGKENEYEFLH